MKQQHCLFRFGGNQSMQSCGCWPFEKQQNCTMYAGKQHPGLFPSWIENSPNQPADWAGKAAAPLCCRRRLRGMKGTREIAFYALRQNQSFGKATLQRINTKGPERTTDTGREAQEWQNICWPSFSSRPPRLLKSLEMLGKGHVLFCSKKVGLDLCIWDFFFLVMEGHGIWQCCCLPMHLCKWGKGPSSLEILPPSAQHLRVVNIMHVICSHLRQSEP